MLNLKSKVVTYDYTNTQNKLLSFTLLWFGLAVGFVIGLSSLILFVPATKSYILNLYESIGIPGFFSLLIVYIIIIISFGYTYRRTGIAKLYFVIPMFLFVVLFNALLISGVMILLKASGKTTLLLPLFGIPVGGMLIMGVLGYFKVFNFGKLGPFLSAATIIFFIYFLIAFLVIGQSQLLKILYGAFGILIFLGWTGFDFYWIRTRDEQMARGNYSTNEYISISIFFAFRLFIDFIQLIWFTLYIFSN